MTIDPHDLVAQLGSEVAAALSSALERVNTLATTGRIDRDGLRLLREEVERARRVGMMGQQVSRFASGRVRLASERLNLTNLLHEALRQRGREFQARGVEVSQAFAPAEVTSDATLLFSLLQAVLDWSLEHTVSRVDLTLDVRGWPSQARIVCAFAHRPPDRAAAGPTLLDAENVATLDTMSWRLVQQTAAVLGLTLERKDNAGRTLLVVLFPQTLAPTLHATTEPEEAGAPGAVNSQPLAGRHVLVVATRREVRNTVREAVRNMGLMLDFVTSIEEANEFCRSALPHALVVESLLSGARLERLRADLLAAMPSIAFIEIAEEGRAFQTVNVGGRQVASVGRDALLAQLPAALTYELTRLRGPAG